MVADSKTNVELPVMPAPAHTHTCAMHKPAGSIVTEQPRAVNQMSMQDTDVMRLRGGCGCLIGGVHVETGPCICHTNGHGLLGCLACIVIIIPNCVAGGVIGTLNCLLCGALHNVHCGTADSVSAHH